MDKSLSALAAFHITGERLADELDDVGQLTMRPALFGVYRDLRELRYDYPLVLVDGNTNGEFVRSLPDIVDEMLCKIAPRGAAGERLRQHVLKLEGEARSLTCDNLMRTLGGLWDDAGQQLCNNTTTPARQALNDSLKLARENLQIDGEVVDCNHELPSKLVTHAWALSQRERTRNLRAQIERLTLKLSDILKTDFMHSVDAHGAQALQRSMGSVGNAEFDFEAMSRLLNSVPGGEALPEARRRRIRSALSVMKAQRFVATDQQERKRGRHKPVYAFAFDSCEHVLEAFKERLPDMAKLVKAMAIAELEINNRYDDSKHGPFFRRFDQHHLRAEDFTPFPSYLVCLRDSNDVAAQNTTLWQVLSSALPIKVLVQFDNILDTGPMIAGIKGSKLATMALGLGNVFVMQSSSSCLYQFRDAIGQGLATDTPALFSVYCGAPSGTAKATTHAADVAPYLVSAAAAESRAFPGYAFNPEAGTDWASRFHLIANPQQTADWPVHSFSYEDEDLQRKSADVAFTFVDYVACDRRYASRLALVPKTRWHDGMVSVDEFLSLDDDARTAKVPYIWMIDEHDTLHRAIVEDSLIDAAQQSRDMWRSLQELAGINNSHAKALLATERESWQLEKEQELEALRAQAESAVETTVREVTGDAAPQETAPEVSEAADELAESKPVDEAYIETPRCTTCNECTELNNKMFAYNDNMQAYIADINAGTYRQLVEAAETCQVAIIHPGKPRNADEPGLSELQARAEAFN